MSNNHTEQHSGSNHGRYSLIAVRASTVIVVVALLGIAVFGSLAGDSFPFFGGLSRNSDIAFFNRQDIYQSLESLSWVLLISGSLLGIGSMAAYKHGR